MPVQGCRPFTGSSAPCSDTTTMASDPQNLNVQLTSQVLAISAPTVHSGPTSRPSVVVIWSANGKPFVVRGASGTACWSGEAAIIAPHFVRALSAQDCHILSVNFEPNHPCLPSLRKQLGGKGLVPLDPRRVRAFSYDMQAAVIGGNPVAVDGLATELAVSLMPASSSARARDARVTALLARLEEQLCAPPSIAELAREARISEDRMSHLLSAEIGMPYRSYVLWRRYWRALRLLHSGLGLSDIAQAAGFYDHAHMSRTFLSFFGYSPSAVRRQGIVLAPT